MIKKLFADSDFRSSLRVFAIWHAMGFTLFGIGGLMGFPVSTYLTITLGGVTAAFAIRCWGQFDRRQARKKADQVSAEQVCFVSRFHTDLSPRVLSTLGLYVLVSVDDPPENADENTPKPTERVKMGLNAARLGGVAAVDALRGAADHMESSYRQAVAKNN